MSNIIKQFNATEAAKAFNKETAQWLRLPGTVEYMAALAESNPVKITGLVATKRGQHGGTWLHPKLGVAFARWLDVRFAVWCDTQIDSIIRGQQSIKAERSALRVEFAPTTDAVVRARQEAGKQHKDVLHDIRKMIEDLGLTSADFSADLPDAYGRLQPAFQLPKRECLILVSGYSLALRARIIDRWQELEAGAAPVQLSHSYTDAVAGMEVVARMLRLEGSAALGLVRKATEITAPHLLPALPVYAIDAPAGAPAVSSEPTESLTALMARHRVGVSTRAGNLILQERGLLEKRTRPSSSGTAKSFWSITEKGQEYGKNISSPENPRETQPHWFSAKGEELLRVMGVLE